MDDFFAFSSVHFASIPYYHKHFAPLVVVILDITNALARKREKNERGKEKTITLVFI